MEVQFKDRVGKGHSLRKYFGVTKHSAGELHSTKRLGWEEIWEDRDTQVYNRAQLLAKDNCLLQSFNSCITYVMLEAITLPRFALTKPQLR